MKNKSDILQLMHRSLRSIFTAVELNFDDLQEIRLRSGKPLTIRYKTEDYFLSNTSLSESPDNAVMVSEEMVNETLEYMLRYSRYAFDEEIRQGYITVNGGHRVGISGKVISVNGSIKNIKRISSLNIRLSHEVIGCANPVIPFVYDDGRLQNTLIISPPCCGKTTLLRDMVRQVSDGFGSYRGVNVSVIDERSEIAACYQGIAQNDVGIRSDVFDDCPKAVGMMMAVRALSPAVVAVDEIGSTEDAEAIRYVINSGCNVFATAHGYSLEDIKNKPVLSEIIKSGSFDRFIIMKKSNRPGCISKITDKFEKILA